MQTKGFSKTAHARGLWAMTAAFGLAFAAGCGDSPPEGMATTTPEQVQAQNNMADFMQKQGKMPKAKKAEPTKAAAPAEPEAK